MSQLSIKCDKCGHPLGIVNVRKQSEYTVICECGCTLTSFSPVLNCDCGRTITIDWHGEYKSARELPVDSTLSGELNLP